MGWYELYKNNHYAGGMDFDYFAAVICNNRRLVHRLKYLVKLHNEHRENRYFVSFSRRLIEDVLTYFSEHTWNRQNNIYLSFSNGFLSACARQMKNIPENENIILQAEILNQDLLEDSLMTRCTKADASLIDGICKNVSSYVLVNSVVEEEALPVIVKSLKYFRKCIWDENVRKNLVCIKDFLILCAKMPDTLANQEIRYQAKYLLINFVDGYIPKDVIQGVETLVLGIK